MRNLNKQLTSISSTGAILLLTIFGVTIQKSNAQRDTGSFVNGGQTIFVEKKDNYPSSGKYSYLFIIDGRGWRYDGSHTNWPILKACMDSFHFIDGGHWRPNGSGGYTFNSDKSNWTFGKDGSYKPYTMYAIKHGGHGTPKGTLDSLYFILDENVQLKVSWIFNKGATLFDSSKVTTLDPNCPLPVIWYKLNAYLGDGSILLNWSTATENNNAFFEAERSDGKTDFQKIGEIPTKAIGGNSSMILHYDLNDNNPLAGVNYYRIKQIDNNGEFAYSPIFSAKINPQPGLEVYPNPATPRGIITINAFGFERDTKHEIIVRDNLGKIIREYTFTGTGNIFYLDLDAGVYHVMVSGPDSMGRNKIFQQRLVVK